MSVCVRLSRPRVLNDLLLLLFCSHRSLVMFLCSQYVNDLFLSTKILLFSVICKYLEGSVSIQYGYVAIQFADSSVKFGCFLFHVEHGTKKFLSRECHTFQNFFLSLHPNFRMIFYGQNESYIYTVR